MKTEMRNSICGLLLVPLVFVCFALLPSVQAAPDPPAPGGANTADGANALQNRTTGQFNTAFGTNALFSLTTGNNNAAQGNSALFSLTTGSGNVGIGSIALRDTTIGTHNTAVGNTSMNANTTGSRNTAVGYGTLRTTTTSNDNVAIGWTAMISSTSTSENTVVGSQALLSNLTGSTNTAVGFQSMLNTGASFNTAVGSLSLLDNTGGSFNTAIGRRALENSTTSSDNTAVGYNAGATITTGFNNICLGSEVGGQTTVSNVIAIGLDADNQASNRTFIGNIRGVTVGEANGVAVIIDSDGQLGTVNSSRRFKKDINSIDQASEAILALKPVTYHYKDMDTKKAGETPQFGLIAEDVAEVDPDLVVLDNEGQPLTVRYDAVNVMLLNEFLKAHKKVEEQQASIAKLKSTVAVQQKGMEVLTAQLKEQAAQIQKVSAQLEVNKPAPRTVASK